MTGTVRGLARFRNGARVKEYNEAPWADAVADTGLVVRYRFAGREWDQESGLYYMRARYYDPTLGRWVSEDPIGLAGGANLFGYAGGDPVNGRDPSGLAGDCYKHVDSDPYKTYTDADGGFVGVYRVHWICLDPLGATTVGDLGTTPAKAGGVGASTVGVAGTGGGGDCKLAAAGFVASAYLDYAAATGIFSGLRSITRAGLSWFGAEAYRVGTSLNHGIVTGGAVLNVVELGERKFYAQAQLQSAYASFVTGVEAKVAADALSVTLNRSGSVGTSPVRVIFNSPDAWDAMQLRCEF